MAFDVQNSGVIYSASILAHNMVISADDKTMLEENYAELVQGFSKAATTPNLDVGTMYWLGYACAVSLYMCPIATIKEIKGNEDVTKMLSAMETMNNDKLKNLAADIKLMVNIE